MKRKPKYENVIQKAKKINKKNHFILNMAYKAMLFIIDVAI